MQTVVVTPSGNQDRSYSVMVGPGLIDSLPWAPLIKGKQAFIIADKRLEKMGRRLSTSLAKSGWNVGSATIPVSESAKDYRKIFSLYTKLIENRMDRDSVVFALGGGVIGDLCGFIAGTYLRGIRWVGVPTTLLAQVDSSLGGKTGVNHPLGKNLIGLFHQPSLVVCDTGLLPSLSARDRVSGYGEMIKCSLTFDKTFYDFLVQHKQSILDLESKYLDIAIVETLRHKAEVVRQDEFERAGMRQILNFGHTLGHALETATGYRRFRHGEAVLWGIQLELELSVIRGHLSAESRGPIAEFLSQLPLPALAKELKVSQILSGLKRDKKVKDGKVNFVLLESIGKAVIDNAVSDSDITQAWKIVSKKGNR